MPWTDPKDWGVGEVVTAAKMNQFLRNNLRYLKGQDGQVDIEAAVGMPSLAVNAPAPLARFHTIESADAYAAIIENIKTSGTPHGMLAASNVNSSAVDIFSVNRGVAGGSLTKLFNVRGDGVALSRGHPLFHGVLRGLSSGSLTLTTTPTLLPGAQISITEAGTYLFIGKVAFTATPGGGDNGHNAHLVWSAGTVNETYAFWNVPPSDPSLWSDGFAWTLTISSVPTSVALHASKGAGSSGSGSASGDLYAFWVSP